jgi:two-component system chemotaxis response regulator CheB
MPKLRVLVVDDSAVFRTQIRTALESIEGVEVVGTAPNGKIALDKIKATPVDLMSLDLEMPEMDGLSVLAEIRSQSIAVKTLVFSSHSKRGTEAALEALSRGAYDFVAKPDGIEGPSIRELLAPKIAQLMRDLGQTAPPSAVASTPQIGSYPPVRSWDTYRPQLIVIGSSTGGPGALETLFSKIRAPLACPIAIVQHMPPVFTTTLAQRLAKISGLDVVEAAHLDVLSKSRVYLAPGDFHMRLKRDAACVRITLDREAQRNSVRPAVDHLFESAVPLFGKDCFGLVLTGMGEDGMAGSVAIKEAGGRVMIQEPESCVVFGMPGAVKRSGAYDRIGDLSEIAGLINRLNGQATQGAA